MNLVISFVTWLADNLFGVPAILLGSVVLIGLLLQNKSASQVITGTIKAIIGYLVIDAGSGIVVGSLTVFEPMWSEVFGLEATEIGSYMGQSTFNAEFGSAVTLAMTLGFLINVLLARFTKFKYIYLTGHMMFWTTTIFAGIVVQSTGGDIGYWQLVIFLTLIMGLYWTFQPAATQPIVRKITGGNQIALGHTSAGAGLLGALAGKLLGNKEQDAEKIKMPEGLDFLRDNNVITSLTMGLLFFVGALILTVKNSPGAQELMALSGSQNFVVYSVVEGITFAAGIAVILYGVRMFVGEIVPAFKGIADRVVPGAIPALDAPVLYTYSPNSVILGFLGAFVGALIWLVVLGNTVGYVFVPTMIVLFFHGAIGGVFGNETGGVRGALLGGFLTATVVAVGQFVMVRYLMPDVIPDTAMWAADTDMFILGPIIKFIADLIF